MHAKFITVELENSHTYLFQAKRNLFMCTILTLVGYFVLIFFMSNTAKTLIMLLLFVYFFFLITVDIIYYFSLSLSLSLFVDVAVVI